MAAILKLRRGTTASPSLVDGELFLNYTTGTVQFASGSIVSNLLPLDKSVTGNILLTGNISSSGDISGSNLYLTGDITARDISARNVVLSGDIFLGDGNQSTDNIYVNASFSGSLLPDITSVYTLGNENYKYKELHTVSASIENISVPGSGILSSSLQDFDTYSSSIESQLDSVYTFTQSADQRLTSIEVFTQSIDSRVDSIETFTQSVDLRVTDLESTGSDHELRIVDLESTGSDHETRITSIESYSASLDSRLDDLEESGSNHESRIDILELSQSYFDNTFSSSVDSRLDLLENFSSSQYQADSQSFDDRIQDLTTITGSYATTGSNIFIGNQIITGSILGSGSVSFNSIPWPTIGTETHLFKTNPYTVSLASGDRDYSYLGIALEQVQTASYYENSLLFYTYDDPNNRTYGSETLIGPVRNHMRVLASGSGHLANISIEDTNGGATTALFYADDIQIGVFTGSFITIGNSNTVTSINGNNLLITSPITSSNTIEATYFYGDGSNLLNVTASYVEYTNVANKPTLVSGSSQIDVNETQNFQSFSQSVDLRLDSIEGPLSESINQQLNSIHSYTSSLKNAIEVSGQNLTVFGDLVVEGTTTTINTQELLIEDKLLAIGSGSTTSTDADGGGFFISGANASILWNHLDQTLDFNTKISSSIGFKGDGSEIINVPFTGIEFGGSGIVSGSSQIDLTQTTNYVSGIKDRMNADGVFSSSIQVNADDITNFDSNVADALNEANVHSGSYLGTATTSNLTEGINLYWTQDRFLTASYQQGFISGSQQLEGIFLEINGDGVVSGSPQIDVNETQNFQLFSSSVDSRLDVIETTFSSSVDSRLDNLNLYTQSTDLRLDSLEGYSSSVETRVSNLELTGSDHESRISDIESSYLHINGDGVLSGSDQVTQSLDSRYEPIASGDNTLVSSSLYFTNAQGIFSASINGIDTVIDLGLSTSAKPTFENINLPNLLSLPTASEFSALLYSSSGEITYSELGTAAYYHVSQSIANGDPNTLGNAKAVKDYIDEQLLIIGAGDITSVNAGDGMSGGALSGSATLTLDTGSTHFIDGVNGVVQLGDGVVSGSDQVTQSLDTRYVNESDFTPFSESVDIRLDSLELFSSSLDDDYVTQVELASATGALENSIATKLDSSSFNSFTQSYNLDSSSFDFRLDSIEGVSGSYATTGSNTFIGNQVISGSVDIQNSISSVDYIDFRDGSTTAYNEGRLFYDEVEGALSFYNDEADITLQLGQEFYKRVMNKSGETILDGTPVRISGSTGDLAQIWPATAEDHTTSSVFENHIIGIATHTILDNEIGYVTEKGIVRNIDTSLFNAGDTLYLQTGSPVNVEDYYRNTPPPFPYDVVQVGTVIRSNPGDGFIEVSPKEPVHFGVISGLSGSDATTGDLWVRKSNNSWTPSKTLEGDYTIVGNISASSYSGLVSESAQIDVEQTTNYDQVVNISGSQTIVGEKTFTGTQIFDNITVNGTGSFAYLQSVTGSAKIIGDAYIVLNNDTPTERYAGIKVYDSGSAGVTASFEFDGQTNDWFYQYSDDGGVTVDHGVTLFGPEYSTKGSPTYPTSNTIQKGNGDHHLLDSNITDTGTLITLGSNVQVNGNISLNGTVDGIDLQLFSGSVDSRLDTLEGTSNENPLTFTDTDTINFTRAGDNIFADVIGGIVSSSAQISEYNVFLEKNGDDVISGSSQVSMGGDLSGTADNAQIVAGAITDTEVSLTAGIDHTKLNFGGSGIVSGSAGVTLGGDVTGAANANTVEKIQGVSITSDEATQLANIDSTTISTTQWGYVGALDQGLTTTSTVQFGKVGVGGASDATYELKVTGDIGATGDVVAYVSSDRRLKNEITPIQNSLQKINSIGGYSFVWNEKSNIYKGKDYGVIAQEIENILPELVETRENGYKAVKYDRIVSLLIEGIKELSKEVSELKEKIGK